MQAVKDAANNEILQPVCEALPVPEKLQDGDAVTVPDPPKWVRAQQVKKEVALKTSSHFQKTNIFFTTITARQDCMKECLVDGLERLHERDLAKLCNHVGPQYPKLASDTRGLVVKIKSNKPSVEDAGVKLLCHGESDPLLLKYASLRQNSIVELDAFFKILECSCDAVSNKGKSVTTWEDEAIVVFKRMAVAHDANADIKEALGFIALVCLCWLRTD